MIGQTISHYKIVSELGRGGMGIVYKAEDTKLKRTIAIKFLTPQALGDQEEKARFIREAQAVAALDHPNISTVHEIDEVLGKTFIVMAYVEGQSLKEKIESGPHKLVEALELAIQIAQGLQEAHEKGVVHRDIKSANVMVNMRGEAKIMDFGLAKLAERTKLTKRGMTVGTVAYMSPEQARGEDVDHRTDIWSLGIVLYEMITGQLPFKGDYEQAVIYSVMNEEPEPMTGLRTGVPIDLERLVNKALAKNPDERYQNVNEIVVDLKRLIKVHESKTQEAASTRTSVEVGNRHYKYGAATLIAIIILMGGVYLISGRVFTGSEKTFDSIAVLPFENVTDDPEVAFLCDGIPERLINRLSLIPGFKVISRTSAFALRDRMESLIEVGRILNVNAVLIGRLERRVDELVISAELVDLRDNTQIWGERYRLPARDLPELENIIAASISEHLELQLSTEIQNRLSRSYPVVPEAYELYLKGNFLAVGSPTEMDLGLEYFRQAVSIDPGFALGHAGLADALATHGWLSLSPRGELVPEAMASIRIALSIEPELPEVQSALGNIRTIFEWDWDGAEIAFKNAIKAGPSNALAYQRYSALLAVMNRAEEALAIALRAQQLDPVAIAPTHWVGLIYLLLDDYMSAASEFQKLIELHPGWSWGYIKLATAYAAADRYEAALQVAAEAEARNGGWGSAWEQSWLGSVYVMSGRSDLAQRALDRILVRAEREYVDPFALGQAYANLCNVNDSFHWLLKAVEEKTPNAIYMDVIRLTSPPCVSDDPRFATLLSQMGLPTIR